MNDLLPAALQVILSTRAHDVRLPDGVVWGDPEFFTPYPKSGDRRAFGFRVEGFNVTDEDGIPRGVEARGFVWSNTPFCEISYEGKGNFSGMTHNPNAVAAFAAVVDSLLAA